MKSKYWKLTSAKLHHPNQGVFLPWMACLPGVCVPKGAMTMATVKVRKKIKMESKNEKKKEKKKNERVFLDKKKKKEKLNEWEEN